MSVIRIGIVEDEVIIADDIEALLQDMGYEVIEPCISYEEAIAMVHDGRPDLVLVDINLGGDKDGIDVGNYIRTNIHIPFVFLTANSDVGTVQRAKACGPDAYLVKPFDKADLYSTIEIALHNFSSTPARLHAGRTAVANRYIFVKDGDYFHRVNYEDILYLASEHVYVTLHTLQRKFLVRATMQDYQNSLDPALFFRIHRGYIVNLDRIEKVNAGTVVIAGMELPLSKNYRDQLLHALNIG